MKVYSNIIYSLLCILIFALSGPSGFSQEVKIKASIDSSIINVGDQIKYHIDTEQPADAVIQIPELSEKISGKIEIIQVLKPDTIKDKKLLKIRHDYLITSFDSGMHSIPQIVIPYSVGNKKDTITTDSLALSVMNIPVDTVTRVIDIKSPLKTPVNLAEAWPYIVIGWFIVLIVVLVWLLVTKKRKKGFFYVEKKIEPADVIALRELDNLRAKKLWQNNKVKQYYIDLTEIIRKYIEKRFEIMALEMTSDEIFEAFRNNNFVDPESKVLLKNLFTLADLVKFAKAQPLPDENEVSLLNAYQFVNNTKVSEPMVNEEDKQEMDNNEDLKN